jgi:hypothetical protein
VDAVAENDVPGAGFIAGTWITNYLKARVLIGQIDQSISPGQYVVELMPSRPRLSSALTFSRRLEAD